MTVAGVVLAGITGGGATGAGRFFSPSTLPAPSRASNQKLVAFSVAGFTGFTVTRATLAPERGSVLKPRSTLSTLPSCRQNTGLLLSPACTRVTCTSLPRSHVNRAARTARGAFTSTGTRVSLRISPGGRVGSSDSGGNSFTFRV